MSHGHILKSSLLFLALFFIFCTMPPQSLAAKQSATWNAVMQNHLALPSLLVAVDKTKQQIVVLNGKGFEEPLSYICTTGQEPGDKQVQGDLKTPEGVYFVMSHLSSGLDYFMYGKEAYTLNYPNPVDKLRRKTGYGIWIHGKGEPIRPLLTQGCVAMQNDDLASIAGLLSPGTPVALAHSVSYEMSTSEQSLKKVAKLTQRVEDWGFAWSNRSATFFDFYDSKAYTDSTEPFNAFKEQKKRLFKSLPWVKNEVENIQVLQGPGYWVTWFHQTYTAPNLSTQGVRRLYWYETKSGDFKIVGMEWLPSQELATQAMYVALDKKAPHKVLAEKSPAPKSTSEVAASPSDSLPMLASAQGLATPQAEPVVKAQVEPVVAQVEPVVGQVEPVVAQVEKPVVLTPFVAPAVQLVEKSPTASEVSKPSSPNTTQDNTTQDNATQDNATQDKTTAEKTSGLLSKDSEQSLAGKNTGEQGQKNMPPKMDNLYASTEILLDSVVKAEEQAAPLRSKIEEWRKAWQAGDLTVYLSFYADKATQGNLIRKSSIVMHKEKLWARNAPQIVKLENVNVKINGQLATVEMLQTYLGADGRGDKGIKTLHFEQNGDNWLIIKEEWRAETT